MTTRLEKMRERLTQSFAPIECRLDDESHLHVGHAGAAGGAGHYRLYLISERFEGVNRVGRHRLVYDCLQDLMQNDIHALAITALAPSEVSNIQPTTRQTSAN